MRRTSNNTFIARKAEIDMIPACLAALSDEFFHPAPDDVTTSAHVGTSGHYMDGLRQISEAEFQAGDHAR